MDAHSFFLHLLLILISARVFSEIATRINLPSVLGELLAGIILGPSLLGWVEPTEIIKLFAEIGIILLLFEVGLGTDVKRLVNAGKQSVIVASVGFILPLALGFSLGYWVFNMSILVSLFIGGTLTATSIGITVRVLTEFNRQHKSEGQIVLGAAVLDDILGVLLLAILFDFSVSGNIAALNITKVILFMGVFFVIAPIAAKLISYVINQFERESEVPGLLPTTIVSLVLFFAWLAHFLGAPELLGGFAAGLALSRRFFLPLGIAMRTDEAFSSRVEVQMKPISYLFTPIFFVYVGLSLNLKEIDWSSTFIWQLSLSLLVIAFISKMIGALLIKETWKHRLAIGVAMIPRGEVGLIFAELGRVSGIFNNDIHASMVIVIALTTLIPPLIMKCLYGSESRKVRNQFTA